MKGKTGKPSAMRGGGMARKGVGMALKGGGMARKGTGSNADPGGKEQKMAGGGEAMGRRPRPGAGDMVRPGFPSRPVRPGGSTLLPSGYADGGGKPNIRPGQTPKPGMSGGKGGPKSGTIPQDVRGGANALSQFAAQNYGAPGAPGGVKTPGSRPNIGPENILVKPAPGSMMKKNGGKVAKYAKGGAVKMTAGAGSGSGRLEKVAAHKAAKRVPAQNLKHGGKAKGK